MTEWVVSGVSSERIESIWPKVEPLLQKAIDRGHGEHEAGDILGFLLSRDMQLWIAADEEIRAAMVTQIINYPRLSVCQVIYLGGEGLKFWKSAKPLIEAWAKSQGCQELRAYGRRGWCRVFGMEDIYTVASRRLV